MVCFFILLHSAKSPGAAEGYTKPMDKLLLRLRDYRLELIAFGSGAVVMIFELVGARMVAPYFGTSLYVWTAIIGVILGALSVGYWYGGRLADRGATNEGLMKIITLAAGCIVLTMFFQEPLLAAIANTFSDSRVSALIASLILFAPAAVFLGVVSPYVVRLKLASLKTAGSAVGRLYAAGTFGSIAGTFLAGYWLIALLGNRQLGLTLVIVLIVLSFVASRRIWWVQRAVVLSVAISGLFITPAPLNAYIVSDTDSAYSRYIVTETSPDGVTKVRAMAVDPFSTQSAAIVGNPDVLFFEYTQRFMDTVNMIKPENVLVVGGGMFTFPLAVSRAYPESNVTAVEIDPALTPLAKDYFGLEDRRNLNIVNEDGRVYLNRAVSNGQFDAVYMDAFSSLTPPYQLTTTEAVGRLDAVTADDGIIVVNLIATAEKSPYLDAVVATYRDHFQNVVVYQLSPSLPRSVSQNLLVVATDDGNVINHVSDSLELPKLFVDDASPLTDDHAPVEQLINQQ